MSTILFGADELASVVACCYTRIRGSEREQLDDAADLALAYHAANLAEYNDNYARNHGETAPTSRDEMRTALSVYAPFGGLTPSNARKALSCATLLNYNAIQVGADLVSHEVAANGASAMTRMLTGVVRKLAEETRA